MDGTAGMNLALTTSDHVLGTGIGLSALAVMGGAFAWFVVRIERASRRHKKIVDDAQDEK